jgi:hypothetical protein
MRGLLRGVRGSRVDEDPFRIALFQGVSSYLVADHGARGWIADWTKLCDPVMAKYDKD